MHNSTTQTLTAVLPTSLWLLISILGCARRYTSRCSLVLQCSRFRLLQNYGYGLSVLRLQDCSATSRFDCMEFHAWHATRWGFHGFRRACQHLLLGFGDSRNMSFKGLWEQGSMQLNPAPFQVDIRARLALRKCSRIQQLKRHHKRILFKALGGFQVCCLSESPGPKLRTGDPLPLPPPGPPRNQTRAPTAPLCSRALCRQVLSWLSYHAVSPEQGY